MPFYYNSISQYDAIAILDYSSTLVHQCLKHMGRFEVQNFEGKYLYIFSLVEGSPAWSAIALLPSRSLNSASIEQASKVLHMFIMCCTFIVCCTFNIHGDIWRGNSPPPPLAPLKPAYYAEAYPQLGS